MADAATITVDQSRLARITALSSGSHEPPNGHFEACAMEAVAYVAGEPWSDHPECASPVIAAFMRSWNDSLPDEDRTRLLLPYVPRLVGTRGSPALEVRRATMAADWLVRTCTPAWLRLAGLTAEADALAALPEIVNFDQVPSIKGPLEAARKSAAAAWSAAGSAARDAAGEAAWGAAWSAARSATWEAAWEATWEAAWGATWEAAGEAAWSAARSATWEAAWSAARSATWEAARSATWDALKPTVVELQQSGIALLDRMIAATA